MTSKQVPNPSSKQDPEWEVVVNRKRGEKKSLSKNDTTPKKTDETMVDNSKRHKRRAEKRKNKALLAETNASELFDMVSGDLATPGEEVHVMLPDEMKESELFKAKLKPTWEVLSYRRICPARRNSEPMPKEYRNRPDICTCEWTGGECERGPWLLVRNPKTSPITETMPVKHSLHPLLHTLLPITW